MASPRKTTAKASTSTYASVWNALADTKEQAANLRTRAELMQQLAEVVKGSGWTQVEAANRCGITQPRINDLLRGRVSRFSIDALVNIATAFGRTVHFELQAA
jgi:predicted XRE-type DNA-binding protein